MENFNGILDFLKKLKKNNDREWFNDNKKEFESARDQFIGFLGYLIGQIEMFDKNIVGVDPKKSMYRIYRDTRFSKDKTPYKSHFGGYICAGGRASGNPGYYVHIEPDGNSIIGGGLYHPMPDVLAKVRQEIDYNGGKLMEIMNNDSFKKRFDIYEEDKLVRPPKGYDETNPHIEWLKMKSFLVMESFSDKDVLGNDYVKNVVSGFKEMAPFIGFLREGMS